MHGTYHERIQHIRVMMTMKIQQKIDATASHSTVLITAHLGDDLSQDDHELCKKLAHESICVVCGKLHATGVNHKAV